MRIAVVCSRASEDERARIAQARASGAEVVVVAAPEVGRGLGPEGEGARWANESECDRAGPGARHGNSALAFQALRASAGAHGFDEARFAAGDALGFIPCAEARLDGPRVARRLVVEVAASDVSLAAPLPAGFSLDARLQQEAARWALRDADAVTGDESARQRLAAAGWQLAQPPARPAWEREPGREPRVTAVVTTYNLGRWLPAALDSVRAQTVPVEIVLVDDGSRPEEAALVDAEVARDPSIRLLRQANQGVARARNAGVLAATTELVMIFDADNLMRPRLIERLREALRLRPDASWATSAFRLFDDETGGQTGVYGPIDGGGEALFLVNSAGDACALHRREALLAVGGFSAPPGLIEDWDLWLQYAESGRHGVAIPEILFDYRERRSSRSRSFTAWENLRQRFELARRHPSLLGRHGEALATLAASRLLEELEEARAQARRPLERERAELLARLDALGLEASALRASLERARAEHQESLERVRAEHQESLERARAEHQESLERARAEHQDSLGRARAELQDSLGRARAALQLEEEKSRAHELARHAAERREEAALEMAGKAREAARSAEQESAAAAQAVERHREAERVARAAQQSLEERLAALEAALHEMAGSSAVGLSRALERLNPALHKLAGRAARSLLTGLARKP